MTNLIKVICFEINKVKQCRDFLNMTLSIKGHGQPEATPSWHGARAKVHPGTPTRYTSSQGTPTQVFFKIYFLFLHNV